MNEIGGKSSVEIFIILIIIYIDVSCISLTTAGYITSIFQIYYTVVYQSIFGVYKGVDGSVIVHRYDRYTLKS